MDIKALSLREAARIEAEGHPFVAGMELQPRWQDIPPKIAINVAVSGRATIGQAADGAYPCTLEEYLSAAGQVIEAGACGIHVDFSMVTDPKGRRLWEIPAVDAYRIVLEPLRERHGWNFVANLNVLNGKTFEECISPATAGLAEVAPCASGHPDAFMIPAFRALEQLGVKPEIVVHSSGEIELAKRKLIDAGHLKKPYYWIILYGLPFNTGRTLISGTWVSNTQDMTHHLFMMVNQIRQIDPGSVITVCAAGRATLYMTTLATMMGVHIRVGTEDTTWKHPHSDERLGGNLEMFHMARDIAGLLGRTPATADEYRQMIGLKQKGARR